MEDSTSKNKSRREALLIEGVGPYGTETGYRLSLRIISASLKPVEEVLSLALLAGIAAAEIIVSSDTQPESSNIGDIGTRTGMANSAQVMVHNGT